MESLREIVKRQQAGRPNYYDDPQKDQMLALILELAEEVCVLKSRAETCELLVKTGETCTPAALDQFQPDAELQDQRLREYTEYFEQLFIRIGNFHSS